MRRCNIYVSFAFCIIALTIKVFSLLRYELMVGSQYHTKSRIKYKRLKQIALFVAFVWFIVSVSVEKGENRMFFISCYYLFV